MNRADIIARVGVVAAETFGCRPAQIHDATVAADIDNWDSLRHAIFIMGLEQEFGIEFDMDEVAGLTNVAALITLIERAPP